MAVSLTVTNRAQLGRQVKALRREGLTPANIVCKGKDSRSIQANSLELDKALQAVGYTQPLQLDFKDDQPATVLVTQIRFHPAKGTLEHVTFQEVKQGQTVTADVPIILVGDAPGTQQGLILLQTMYSVEVEAGAMDLPQQLEVDVSALEENGQAVRLGAIKLPAGAVIQAEPDEPVARLEMPRLKVSQDQEEEEGEIDPEAEADAEADDQAEAGSTDQIKDSSQDSQEADK